MTPTPSSQVYKALKMLVKKNMIDPPVAREFYEKIDLLCDTIWEEAEIEIANIVDKLESERKEEIGKMMKAAKKWNGTADTEKGNGKISGDGEKDGKIDTVAENNGENEGIYDDDHPESVMYTKRNIAEDDGENEGSVDDGQPESVLYTKQNIAYNDTDEDEIDRKRSVFFHPPQNRISKQSLMKTQRMRTRTTAAEPLFEKCEMPSKLSKDNEADKIMTKMLSAKNIQSKQEYNQLMAAGQQENAKANGAEDGPNDDCGNEIIQQQIPEAERDWTSDEILIVSSDSTTSVRLSVIQEETEPITTSSPSVPSAILFASNGHPTPTHPSPNTTTNKKKMSVGKVVNCQLSTSLAAPRRSARLASLSSLPTPSISLPDNSANMASPENLNKNAKGNVGGRSRADCVPTKRCSRLADKPVPDYFNRKSVYPTTTKY